MWISIDHIVSLFPASFLDVFYIILIEPLFCLASLGLLTSPPVQRKRRDWDYDFIILVMKRWYELWRLSDCLRFCIQVLCESLHLCVLLSPHRMDGVNSTFSWGLLWGLNRIVFVKVVWIQYEVTILWNRGVQNASCSYSSLVSGMSVLCQTLNKYEVICPLSSRILEINEYMQKHSYIIIKIIYQDRDRRLGESWKISWTGSIWAENIRVEELARAEGPTSTKTLR